MRHIFERWMRLVKEKDVISGREALKRRLEAKVLCAVPDYVPFSMRAILNDADENKHLRGGAATSCQ